ncbi:MAG: nucleotidyltransferase substrate binding protein [Bacteroidota bacterium]|nr:nucleotidyltransferase substrate binding protein [Bacteroidota bacterium]
MQNGKRLSLLFNDLLTASSSFEQSLQLDLKKFSEFESDVIKSGQLQKFEYTIELLWKTLKKYFELKREIFLLYPKDVIKAFFAETAITEETYITLIDAIDSRNLLSHVYKVEMFELVHPLLNNYAKAIRHTCTAIEPHTF